ncbi:hypothetical protein ASPVEDRAFT_651314 [Aspergillus versicolor CBS 583.65]|uniref:Uncharacterized protein n=1 Tax=Aspergillus versicolor CBS 583.65 TaxID=1036611 RepID=A0A1L9PJT7_ASPVE|nr:uncharacterized protein ASPVEDRAFT_651314 [Aspergillus versicolor CBS 583.65]OJJ01800.1 hypothetical protein ASPVEDRAFT_651314 [Aspergillus versicolor CBS 583.65]
MHSRKTMNILSTSLLNNIQRISPNTALASMNQHQDEWRRQQPAPNEALMVKVYSKMPWYLPLRLPQL